MNNDTDWTADQHYARGMADALGQTYVYLLQHGPDDLGEWLKRRERGFMALLPTDANGNTQFTP